MSRKSLVGVLIVILATVSSAAAADQLSQKWDNVFIAGLDVDYFGHTGWVASNYSGGVGGSLFFGYGIVKNFSIEIDWTPLITSSPTGKDVKSVENGAYWGGIAQKGGGAGGWGVSGKLYPRDRFRDADYVIAQPYARMGFGYMPFIWAYKSADKALFNNKSYDGFNSLYVDVGGGCDFMISKNFSLGPDVRLWKFFVVGKSLAGNKTTGGGSYASKYENSLMYNLGLNVTFQW